MTEKVYGLHAVRALLTRHAERVNAVTLAEGSQTRFAEIEALAKKAGKPLKRAAPAIFKQLFGDAVHQGVFADVQPLPPWHEEELIAAITRALESGNRRPRLPDSSARVIAAMSSSSRRASAAEHRRTHPGARHRRTIA